MSASDLKATMARTDMVAEAPSELELRKVPSKKSEGKAAVVDDNTDEEEDLAISMEPDDPRLANPKI